MGIPKRPWARCRPRSYGWEGRGHAGPRPWGRAGERACFDCGGNTDSGGRGSCWGSTAAGGSSCCPRGPRCVHAEATLLGRSQQKACGVEIPPRGWGRLCQAPGDEQASLAGWRRDATNGGFLQTDLRTDSRQSRPIPVGFPAPQKSIR